MFWSWSFFIIITSHRTLCYWWKCSWNAVHVSLPVQRPVVLWLHSDRLLRKTSLVCGRNKISNWTLGLLPSYLWVLPMKAFVLKRHIHRVHVHWLQKRCDSWKLSGDSVAISSFPCEGYHILMYLNTYMIFKLNLTDSTELYHQLLIFLLVAKEIKQWGLVTISTKSHTRAHSPWHFGHSCNWIWVKVCSWSC